AFANASALGHSTIALTSECLVGTCRRRRTRVDPRCRQDHAEAMAPRLNKAWLWVSLAATAFPVSAQALELPFTKSTLPNGLTVILHEDHTLPLVAVNIMVRVGSRFEEPRRTGFAHLFEHLMFMGTNRVPTKMFDAWMEEEGGWNNAWTSE